MLTKRSFSLAGHRTSVALEAEFWSALESSAERRGVALSALVARIDADRTPTQPLASALRLLALREAAENPASVNVAETVWTARSAHPKPG